MPHRTLPWVQLGAGVLWTDHKFPVAILSPFRTCVLNVTPQVGAGTSIGLSGQRTLDFALKAANFKRKPRRFKPRPQRYSSAKRRHFVVEISFGFPKRGVRCKEGRK